MIRDVGLVAAAYLLGSVPFGVLAARAHGGVDLRRVGSGNIGTSNVLRALGRGAAAMTLLGDMGKGALAVGLGRWVGVSSTALAAIAVAAVAGHLFPVFLGFRGGKGVATALGVILVVMPPVGGLLVLIWIGVAAIWRFASLAALVACAALPAIAWLLDVRREMLAMSVVLTILVCLRHGDNIGRLWRGTERKIGQRIAVSNGQAVE